MIVAIECSFYIYESRSLKSKRAIIRPKLDQIKARYNVSIAEIDHQDLWQRATFRIVATSASRPVAEKEARRALHVLEMTDEWELTEIDIIDL